MSNETTPAAIAALSALAHEQRLTVFRLLVQAGPEGMSAGNIAEAVQSPASSMSFHLAHLHRAGLIAQRRESRSLIYTAAYNRIAGLIEFLLEDLLRRPSRGLRAARRDREPCRLLRRVGEA